MSYRSLFLSDYNGRSKMQVDDDQQLMVTRLEEKVFDIAEENV